MQTILRKNTINSLLSNTNSVQIKIFLDVPQIFRFSALGCLSINAFVNWLNLSEAFEWCMFAVQVNSMNPMDYECVCACLNEPLMLFT